MEEEGEEGGAKRRLRGGGQAPRGGMCQWCREGLNDTPPPWTIGWAGWNGGPKGERLAANRPKGVPIHTTTGDPPPAAQSLNGCPGEGGGHDAASQRRSRILCNQPFSTPTTPMVRGCTGKAGHVESDLNVVVVVEVMVGVWVPAGQNNRESNETGKPRTPHQGSGWDLEKKENLRAFFAMHKLFFWGGVANCIKKCTNHHLGRWFPKLTPSSFITLPKIQFQQCDTLPK